MNSEEFSSGLTDISLPPPRITTLKEKNLTTRQRERSSCRGLNPLCLSQNAMIDAKEEAEAEANGDNKNNRLQKLA